MMTGQGEPTVGVEGLGDTLQDRVRRAISLDIESGRYGPGDRLPAEREIAAHLGVSLAPVRGALEQLSQRGVVLRRQGKGTFVQRKRVQYRLESWHSCTDDLRAQGISFTTRVLSSGTGVPPVEVATALGLGSQEQAFNLRRFIAVDGLPAILLDSWTRGLDAEQLADPSEFEDGRSLYRELVKQGITLTKADTAIEISFTGESESSLFDVPYATPLLQVTGIAHDQTGPREWSRLKYNTAIFSLNMRRDID